MVVNLSFYLMSALCIFIYDTKLFIVIGLKVEYETETDIFIVLATFKVICLETSMYMCH